MPVAATYNLKKVWLWLKTYWYIPVIVVLGIAILAATGGNNKWLFDILQKTRDSHNQERESLENAHVEEIRQRDEALKKYHRNIDKIEKDYKKKVGDLESEKRHEIKEMVKRHQGDSTGLTKEVAERYGFRVVLPKK